MPSFRPAVNRVAILLAAISFLALAFAYSRRPIISWQWAQLKQVRPPGSGEVSFALVGDIQMDRRVRETAERAGGDYRYAFGHVRPYLREVDIAVGNVESTISDRGTPVQKRHVFRTPSKAVLALADAGFDVLSIANNHLLDYGPEAAEDTARLLTQAGIRWGSMVREDAKQEPVIVQVRGVKVGFLFYCDPTDEFACAQEFLQFPVRPPFATQEALARDIGELKSRVDIMVVSLHWGVEYALEPPPRAVSRARWMIDQGVDIVFGHHTHTQQRVERYKQGVIFYSLGNFVFDSTRPQGHISRLYRVIAGANGVQDIALIPMELTERSGEPVPLSKGYLPLTADSAQRRIEHAGIQPFLQFWWRWLLR